MNFYVIQVQTGSEGEYLEIARKTSRDAGIRIYWPRRKLNIRKRGKTVESLAPLFPGYLFVEAEEIGTEVYWALRRTPGFFRFLDSNTNILPLERPDQELLVHFLSFGEIVAKSQVLFDDHSRIRIVNGPLSGLEGRIVKVDKRKGRAKVRLDLYKDSFLVDLGFDIMAPGSPPPERRGRVPESETAEKRIDIS
ncbi:MAG TPA: antiterminator LoaP [Spirochaetia bacterium]|nr:antiterminator LoaP [Spirochaetia bacterium]